MGAAVDAGTYYEGKHRGLISCCGKPPAVALVALHVIMLGIVDLMLGIGQVADGRNIFITSRWHLIVAGAGFVTAIRMAIIRR